MKEIFRNVKETGLYEDILYNLYRIYEYFNETFFDNKARKNIIFKIDGKQKIKNIESYGYMLMNGRTMVWEIYLNLNMVKHLTKEMVLSCIFSSMLYIYLDDEFDGDEKIRNKLYREWMVKVGFVKYVKDKNIDIVIEKESKLQKAMEEIPDMKYLFGNLEECVYLNVIGENIYNGKDGKFCEDIVYKEGYKYLEKEYSVSRGDGTKYIIYSENSLAGAVKKRCKLIKKMLNFECGIGSNIEEILEELSEIYEKM